MSENELHWKRVLDGGLKDNHILLQSFHDDNGDFYALVPKADLEKYDNVDEEEDAAKNYISPTMEIIGTVTGSEAHMLGKNVKVTNPPNRRKYKINMRRTVLADLEGFEKVDEIAAQFDAFEQARLDLKELGWIYYKKARAFCIGEIIKYRPELLEEEMEKNGGKEALAKATLAKNATILDLAKKKFMGEWRDWYIGPPADEEAAKNIKYKIDAFPGEKLHPEWKVFESNTKDHDDKPIKLPRRPIDMNNMTVFTPHSKYTQLSPDEVFPIIESQRAEGSVMTKHIYLDKNGVIDIDEVLCPNGDKCPLWAHPWYQMLRGGKVVKFWVKFKPMDLKTPWWGCKIERVKNGSAFETFIFNPGQTLTERTPVTDPSPAATSVSMRGEFSLKQPTTLPQLGNNEQEEKFVTEKFDTKGDVKKLTIDELAGSDRLELVKRKRDEDEARKDTTTTTKKRTIVDGEEGEKKDKYPPVPQTLDIESPSEGEEEEEEESAEGE